MAALSITKYKQISITSDWKLQGQKQQLTLNKKLKAILNIR
jgi:hypothetical protein